MGKPSRVLHLQAKLFQYIWNFLQESELQAFHFLSLLCREGLTSVVPHDLDLLSGSIFTITHGFPLHLNPGSPEPWEGVSTQTVHKCEPLHRLYPLHEVLLLPLSASWVPTHPAEPLLSGHYLCEAIPDWLLIPTPKTIDHTFFLHYFCPCKYLVPPKGAGEGVGQEGLRFRRGVQIRLYFWLKTTH